MTIFQFNGKPGINVDLEGSSNPIEYFELFCTSEIAEVIARETNWYAYTILETMLNLKLGYKAHHWKEMNRSDIMKLLLLFFFVQELWWKLDNMSTFLGENILETFFLPVQ
jgi:hypothetical protein